jgi:tungstate transport system ATP-binding protein
VATLYDLRYIEHHYDGAPVLSIDAWRIESDSVTGIVGPNGSGKSTLLSLLGFIDAPTRGEIRLDGRPAEPFCDSARSKVALLPQDTFLLKRSVFRNIAYGLKIRSQTSDTDRRVRSAMRMVGLDPDLFGQRPWYALSGGEARRVALASRLVLKPRVLLMDEPTTSVDAASAQMIKAAALHARRQWGTSLIVTSHDRQWLADMCDQVLVMFRGTILGAGQYTLVFGPWHINGDGGAEMPIDANQSFVAHSVPQDPGRSVAGIRADQLHLFEKAKDASHARLHSLSGLLLQLGIDNATGRILASVRIGGTDFQVYVPSRRDSLCRYEPGQTVWVGYDPAAVAWY